MAIKDLIPWMSEKSGSEMRRPFLDLQKEFNDLFNNFWKSHDNFLPDVNYKSFENFRPAINITENDNAYVITAELPGIDQKDIELELKGNYIVLKGEKKEEHEEKKKGSVYSERRYGSFRRQIPLPEEVKVEKVEAKFKNGILNIELPKSEKAKTSRKQIEIKTE